MNLSAVIFVVLAVAWALYLIPMALRHHDEMASDRLDEGHSDRARILSRRGAKAEAPADEIAAEPELPAVAQPVGEAAAPAPERALPTRAAARRAARNRRRVLAVLTVALVVLVGLAAPSYVPWWSAAIPAGLIVAFLVVARISVRRTTRLRARRRPQRTTTVSERPATQRAVSEQSIPQQSHAERVGQTALGEPAEALTAQLADEGTSGVAREQIEAALADDGSLWDPLPMTLPTYVNKARARRTVRTIELTGMTSSGHDHSDSALAREAEQSADEGEQISQRKAAGA